MTKNCVSDLLLLLSASVIIAAHAQRYDCDPCINREKVKLQAITHGTKSSTFWQQVQASMVQAAKDMRVDMSLQLYDSDAFNTTVMANDLLEAAGNDPAPDAIIETIPDATVQAAIGNITQDTDVPVFGFNSGGDVSQLLNVDGHIAMDEYLGGKVAAEYFLMSSADDNKNLEGMFVLSELANIGLQERLLGLTENAGNLPVTTVVVDGSDAADMESVLTEAIAGCSYTHILLGTAEPVAALIQAMKTAGCSFDDVVIGTFDVNEEIFKAITDGQLDFTISQQTHLQASLPVVMASLFATTGRKLSASSESRSGVYLSGPMLINATNLPSLEDQVCRSESFPICPNTLNPVGETASCPCIDRSQIKLRGITHGITTDTFWDTVYEAFGHAAADFGVDVEVIRPEPSDDLYDVMAAAIQDFCSQGIDGLIVSIPSSIVAEALSTCLDNSISVISLNAGSSEAKELGLMNHLGQIEFNAGKRAGEQMIELGVTTGACLRHVVNNTALMDRCNGMKEAFDESEEKVTYFGDMDVSPDAVDTYIADVEAFIGDTGSWDGWGILFGGDAQVVPALSLKEQHSDLVLAAFDTSEAVYKALDSGEIAFAVCQNEYLQGYFPIPLLAWKVYAQQFLISTYVETGPRLYFESPSDAEAQCEANGYEVCSSGAIMQSIGVFGLLLAGMTFVLFGL